MRDLQSSSKSIMFQALSPFSYGEIPPLVNDLECTIVLRPVYLNRNGTDFLFFDCVQQLDSLSFVTKSSKILLPYNM